MNTNMDNWQMATGLVLFTLVIITGAMAFDCRENNGIYSHASGKAVLVLGEACIVNMTEEDTDVLEMNERYIFCQQIHDQWMRTGIIPKK